MLNISAFFKEVMLCMLVRLMYIPIFTLLYRNTAVQRKYLRHDLN